jgi:hypothetical protein
MSLLFTYTVRTDAGSAPNPFNGMCSLAICKPHIRREAERGDWVAGLGSKNAPSGDLSGHLVYAMKVDEVISLQDYDRLAPKRWPHRIPNIKSMALQDRLGDCLYDFSSGSPVQRPGVHDSGNTSEDLGGKNVLISGDFYYFGSRARRLPDNILPICHQMVGRRSKANARYFEPFLEWVRSVAPAPGQLYGWPDFIPEWDTTGSCRSCADREGDDDSDC